MQRAVQHFRRRTRHIFRNLTVSEISGSLGDLGTLLPLLVALSSQRSIALAPTLFFGGLTNLITGLSWDVPMCVQPMKSISAVALSENWDAGRVTAAGIWMGVFILILGATSLIEIVNKVVPGNVVSGLQIGVGIRLASKGINMVYMLGWVDGFDCILLGVICALLCMYWLGERTLRSDPPSCTYHSETMSESTVENGTDVEMRIPNSPSDGGDRVSTEGETLWQRICCKSGGSEQKHPVGIYMFLIGAVFASITLATAKNEDGHFDLPLRFFGAPIAFWAIKDVSGDDWKHGLLEGAIPQLPLTTLNSVISVCALAHSLYPEKRKKNSDPASNDSVISRKEVAISVGLINLVFCLFGSMPNCHGAGGLAGQHRLGARHGTSVVFLGLAKMALAVFFGASALTLLDAFPTSVLGVMLAIAGLELTTTGFAFLVNSVDDEVHEWASEYESIEQDEIARKKSRLLRQNTVISVITAMVIISIGKTHYGAMSGFIAHMIYGSGFAEFRAWYHSRQRRSASSFPFSERSLVRDDDDTSEERT